MTPSQILQAARALIEAGWRQDWYCSERAEGGWDHCILGALNQTGDLLGASGADREAAEGALLAQVPGQKLALHHFNDHPCTTKRRVLALFDRALIQVTK